MSEMTLTPIVEFMSPFEDNLNIAFIGDNFDASEKYDFIQHINDMRYFLGKGEATIIEATTSDIFRDKYKDTLYSENCVIIMDGELSSNVINTITYNTDGIDELELMLIQKYIMGIPQNRYIFNLNKTTDEDLERLMMHLDFMKLYHYLAIDNYLVVWLTPYNEEGEPF